jgi:hypothetical protein
MWKSKNKVHATTETVPLTLDTATSSKKSRQQRHLQNQNRIHHFLDTLGSHLEHLIDNSFLGVPTCEPWSPVTDKKKGVLSNPLEVIQLIFRMEVFPRLQLGMMFSGGSGGGGEGVNPFADLVMASQKALMNVREGLANAVTHEEEMGGDLDMMINVDDDDVHGVSNEPYIDLGADKRANSTRMSNPAVEAKKVVGDFCKKRVLPFLERMAKDSIVVSSDDISVECSVASFAELSDDIDDVDEFEDCPSVVTEVAADYEDEAQLITKEDLPKEVDLNTTQETQDTSDEDNDDEEYVLTEEPESEDEEEFVDVGAEFDVAHCP